MMKKTTNLEKTRVRLAELQADLDGVQILLDEAELSLESSFYDDTAYAKASSVVHTLSERRDALQAAFILGKQLERKEIAAEQLEASAEMAKQRDRLLAQVNKLQLEFDALQAQQRDVQDRIRQLVEQARDLDIQVQRVNREFAL